MGSKASLPPSPHQLQTQCHWPFWTNWSHLLSVISCLRNLPSQCSRSAILRHPKRAASLGCSPGGSTVGATPGDAEAQSCFPRTNALGRGIPGTSSCEGLSLTPGPPPTRAAWRGMPGGSRQSLPQAIPAGKGRRAPLCLAASDPSALRRPTLRSAPLLAAPRSSSPFAHIGPADCTATPALAQPAFPITEPQRLRPLPPPPDPSGLPALAAGASSAPRPKAQNRGEGKGRDVEATGQRGSVSPTCGSE